MCNKIKNKNKDLKMSKRRTLERLLHSSFVSKLAQPTTRTEERQQMEGTKSD